MADIHLGTDFVLAHAGETATYPNAEAATLGTAPTPAYAAYADVPALADDEGSKQGWGLGSPFAMYFVPGMRAYRIPVNFRVSAGNIQLLQMCLQTTPQIGSVTRFHGLHSIALWVGRQGVTSRLFRHCMCESLTLTLTNGGAQEIMAQASFVGLAEQAGAALSPSYASLVDGQPLLWTNTTAATINSVAYRDKMQSLAYSVNNNLKVGTVRGDQGRSNAMSNIAYCIRPGPATETVALTLTEDVAAALINADNDALAWGAIAATANNAAALPTGGTAANFTVSTIGYRKDRGYSGGDPTAQVTYNHNLLASQTTITVA